MARSSGMVITSDTLTPGLKAFPDKVDRAIALTAEYFTPRVEAYARTNAPWTDRTGNARNGLNSKTFHEPRAHGVYIMHSVPYGIWLEVRNDGRYEIIIPTVKNMGREMMATLRSLFSRMR